MRPRVSSFATLHPPRSLSLSLTPTTLHHLRRPYKCPEEHCTYPGAIEAVTLRRHVLMTHGYELAKLQRGTKAGKVSPFAPAATEAVEAAKLVAKVVPLASPGDWQPAPLPAPLTGFARATPKAAAKALPPSAETGLLPWE